MFDVSTLSTVLFFLLFFLFVLPLQSFMLRLRFPRKTTMSPTPKRETLPKTRNRPSTPACLRVPLVPSVAVFDAVLRARLPEFAPSQCGSYRYCCAGSRPFY
jgi:hypothetical protein